MGKGQRPHTKGKKTAKTYKGSHPHPKSKNSNKRAIQCHSSVIRSAKMKIRSQGGKGTLRCLVGKSGILLPFQSQFHSMCQHFNCAHKECHSGGFTLR